MNRRQFCQAAAGLSTVVGAWPVAGAVEPWAALVERGEALLATGNAEGALAVFEAAAGQVHAVDIELGIVRCHMQAGQYRSALSFAAHVAGAHQDEPGAIALYAWLLNAGGQDQVAARTLSAGLTSDPDSRALQQAQQALRAPWPCPGPALMESPLRVAPFEWPAGRAAGAPIVASAMLVSQGRLALAPVSALRGVDSVWLRNGLGQTVGATVHRRNDRTGVASLRLAEPLPTPATLECGAREPFAGSPGSVVAYATDERGIPAWPLLRAGFFGRFASNGERHLGLGAPNGPHGGPVFDAAGRVAGIALSGADGGPPRLIAWADAIDGLDIDLTATISDSPRPRAPLDAVYSTGLQLSLQLMPSRQHRRG